MQVMAAYYIRIGGGNIWGNSAGVGCAVPLRYLICDSPKPCWCCPTFHFAARMRARVCDKLRAIVIPLVY